MKKLMKKRRDVKNPETGIALFMVISALALLSVLIAELTYTTQINVRMAYNGIDNLKSYYLAKAGYKISLLRLKAYMNVSKFVNGQNNPGVKQAIGKDVMDKIWSFPFVYPIPVTDDTSASEKDAISTFTKESNLSGTFTAVISSESGKINLNNLFIKEATVNKSADKSKANTTGTTANSGSTTAENSTETKAVNFRPMIEKSIEVALESRKNEDAAFSDQYRYVLATDVVNAIEAYLFKDSPGSNLPGFKPFTPKLVPFYSITELHFIPGIDDELYSMLQSIFTVDATPGINVNAAGMPLFQALFPEAVKEDLERLISKRDDPDVGKLWESEEDFWKSASEVGLDRGVSAAKSLLEDANLKIITSEQAFRITVTANVGFSTRVLNAFVIIDPNAKNATTVKTDSDASNKSSQSSATNTAQNTGQNPQNPQDNSSAKNTTGVNLVYWRML